jgi:hypothetical protein
MSLPVQEFPESLLHYAGAIQDDSFVLLCIGKVSERTAVV